MTTTIKPYGLFNHPHKNWADWCLDFAFWLFAGIPKLYARPPNDPRSIDTVLSFRHRMLQSLAFTKANIQKWAAAMINTTATTPYKEMICEHVVHVTTSKHILHQGGAISANNPILLSYTHPNPTVAVHFWSPISLFKQQPQQNEKNEIGCVTLPLPQNKRKNHDTNSTIQQQQQQQQQTSFGQHLFIRPGIPVLVWFHGGGQVIGMARDDFGTGRISALMQTAKKTATAATKKDNDRHSATSLQHHQHQHQHQHQQLIVASVEYSLAPENPFPASLVDALSVIEYIRQQFPDSPIHIGASSGGCYPALLSCLLAATTDNSGSHPAISQRQKQQQLICSCTLFNPMLNPATDTMSYYLNSRTDWCCPVPFIRWCWKCVLGSDKNEDTTTATTLVVDEQQQNEQQYTDSPSPSSPQEQNTDPLLQQFLHSGSTRREWEGSRWYRDVEFRRIMQPIKNVPPELSAVRFLVYTSKADPMHDDGVMFVEALQTAKHSVHHTDSDGNHTMSVLSHPKEAEMFSKEWARVLFQ